MADSEGRWDDERVMFRGESACAYCFDFQDFPEVTGGETLSSPAVTISSGSAALLTDTGAAILVAVFEEKDRNEIVEKSVPIGKGVKVLLTPPAIGGAKGECIVTCTVVCSGGATRAKRCKFTIK